MLREAQESVRRIAAVVVAAGASLRFGSPKQLARIGGEMLLARAVRIAREAGCSPIVVVLGAAADRIEAECGLDDALIIRNDGWAEGMGSSVRVGIGALVDGTGGRVEGCVVMTCDMPAVTVDHLRTLSASEEIAASCYGGHRGVPAYFPVGMFSDLLGLRRDAGARDLLRSALAVELVGGEVDVDTWGDFERALRMFGRD